MALTTTLWNLPEVHQIDNEFFRPHEKKQLQNAYKNFLVNTNAYSFDIDEEENAQLILQSKIQLFKLFIRTQPVNIRNFGQFQQQHERVFVERLFYLVLNNVELTNFSTFNINSINHISYELEKYQRTTNKIISNSNKLNTIIQFVLSFSTSTVPTFQLNNLFYLLLHDMNDFSGKIIDRVAELLRAYHSMTYGHSISKQYLIATIDHAISTANYANPVIYPLYEHFLNSSFVYKGPFVITSSISSSKLTTRISLQTIIQNLALMLLGLTIDDFEYEDHFLGITSEQCYHIRLTVRRLTYILKKYQYFIEYPLDHIDKQIVIYLIKSVLIYEKTYDTLKRLLDVFMFTIQGYSQSKVKRLLYDLLINCSFELYAIETIRYFLELNHIDDEHSSRQTDSWLTDDQIRLITHKFYSNRIYSEIFIPLINGDCHQERSIDDLLNYLDSIPFEEDQVIDVQDIKTKLTLFS